MPKAVLLGDIGTEHDGFHVSPVIGCSSTVKIDGRGVARVGDAVAPHSRPDSPPHGRAIAQGSPTVFVDGLPVARTGDAITCGGVVIGSATVNVD